MERQNLIFFKIIKNIKSSNFIYIGILVLLVVIVVIIFSYSTNFVIININKIFSIEKTITTESLNIPNYKLVEKKLNLQINTITENLNTNIYPAEEEFNKKAVTISVLNSTNKKGLAYSLAQKIADSGFSMAYTTNEKKSYDVTTILVKESKKIYAPFIEEVVKKSYKNAITEIFLDNINKIEFDVTVIIGKQ